MLISCSNNSFVPLAFITLFLFLILDHQSTFNEYGMDRTSDVDDDIQNAFCDTSIMMDEATKRKEKYQCTTKEARIVLTKMDHMTRKANRRLEINQSSDEFTGFDDDHFNKSGTCNGRDCSTSLKMIISNKSVITIPKKQRRTTKEIKRIRIISPTPPPPTPSTSFEVPESSFEVPQTKSILKTAESKSKSGHKINISGDYKMRYLDNNFQEEILYDGTLETNFGRQLEINKEILQKSPQTGILEEIHYEKKGTVPKYNYSTSIPSKNNNLIILRQPVFDPPEPKKRKKRRKKSSKSPSRIKKRIRRAARYQNPNNFLYPTVDTDGVEPSAIPSSPVINDPNHTVPPVSILIDDNLNNSFVSNISPRSDNLVIDCDYSDNSNEIPILSSFPFNDINDTTLPSQTIPEPEPTMLPLKKRKMKNEDQNHEESILFTEEKPEILSDYTVRDRRSYPAIPMMSIALLEELHERGQLEYPAYPEFCRPSRTFKTPGELKVLPPLPYGSDYVPKTISPGSIYGQVPTTSHLNNSDMIGSNDHNIPTTSHVNQVDINCSNYVHVPTTTFMNNSLINTECAPYEASQIDNSLINSDLETYGQVPITAHSLNVPELNSYGQVPTPSTSTINNQPNLSPPYNLPVPNLLYNYLPGSQTQLPPINTILPQTQYNCGICYAQAGVCICRSASRASTYQPYLP